MKIVINTYMKVFYYNTKNTGFKFNNTRSSEEFQHLEKVV